jgi:hypothetical protein
VRESSLDIQTGFMNYGSTENAEYQGRKVELDKPFRTPDGPKKFAVYVKNPKGNVIKVTFGDPDMEIKRDDPEHKKSFRARHHCDAQHDKTTAGYWSCRMWGKEKVGEVGKKNDEAEIDNRCWEGYKPVPGKKPYSKGSCEKK